MSDSSAAPRILENVLVYIFYTAIGHDARALNTDFGRHHMLAALRWAAGEV